jgi:hypothetical protein
MMFGATLIAVLMFRPLGILGPMRRDKLMQRMHPEDDEALQDAAREEAR